MPTREGSWQGRSAPNPSAFLQISHPADAKTLRGGCWGRARLRGASLPWDASSELDDVRPPPGIACDVISLCQRRSSQTKAVHSAAGGLGLGVTPEGTSEPSCALPSPAQPAAGTARLCPRAHVYPHAPPPQAPAAPPPSPPPLREDPAAGSKRVFWHRKD